MNFRISKIMLFLALATGLIAMTTARCRAEPLNEIRPLLPASTGEWKADGEDRFYDPKTIF
ncbi:MAG: hypothetical protein JW821_13055, partial [Deltaproteobacteria bacterium]|nr:hypothetical protein [Deltaproteobacteria bacterium]